MTFAAISSSSPHILFGPQNRCQLSLNHHVAQQAEDDLNHVAKTFGTPPINNMNSLDLHVEADLKNMNQRTH